jgi:uncharacterized protein (TIGR02594 family)
MNLRLSIVAGLALCALLASPAIARPHHATHRHHHHRAAVTHVEAAPRCVEMSNMYPCPIAEVQATQRHARAVKGHKKTMPAAVTRSAFSPSLVSEASRWIGSTAADMGVRRSLWCMAAMNKWLEDIGMKGSGSDMASSVLSLGRHVRDPVVGAVAFMYRRGGSGHVGVVSGVDPNGNPILISGNHNNRVTEATYPRSRINTYIVM